MGRIKIDLSVLNDTPPWDWPRGTGEALLDILRNDSASDADLLLAAELAGDFTVINDALVAALLAVSRSARSEPVRGRAAISLGAVLEYADTDGFEDGGDTPITRRTFEAIQQSLRGLYQDAAIPKEVRRRVLEASVRAPLDWHADAIRAAYASDDQPWKLTAVFCMRFVRGFEEQILSALESSSADIHYEAVVAAGNWEIDRAWSHLASLVTSAQTDKALLLAAIDAVATTRPHEAAGLLEPLADHDDEDIAEAVYEALAAAEALDRDTDELLN